MAGRRKPIQHGTGGGYRAHFRHGVPMCEPCRAVERKAKGCKAPQKVAVCGTIGGYHRHLDRREETCRPCRDANNEQTKVYRAKMLARRRDALPKPQPSTP